MVSVMGRNGTLSPTISEVGLVRVSVPEAVTNGTMTDMGNGDILVTFNAVPEGEFVVILKGTFYTEFQREVFCFFFYFFLLHYIYLTVDFTKQNTQSLCKISCIGTENVIIMHYRHDLHRECKLAPPELDIRL